MWNKGLSIKEMLISFQKMLLIIFIQSAVLDKVYLYLTEAIKTERLALQLRNREQSLQNGFLLNERICFVDQI